MYTTRHDLFRFLARTTTAFFLVLCFALAGCGPDDDDDKRPPPPPSQVPLFQAVSVGLHIEAPLRSVFTTSASVLEVAGRLVVDEGEAMPRALLVEIVRGADVHDRPVAVSGDGQWNTSVVLLNGDQEIRLSVPNTTAGHAILVTRNESFEFAGRLRLEPDVAFIGETTQVQVTLAAGEEADAERVRFVRLGESGSEEDITYLRDDGSAESGDATAGDGIYSGRFEIVAGSTGEDTYRAVAASLDGAFEARSERKDVLRRRRFTEGDLALVKADNAWIADRIDTAAADGKGALDELVEAIRLRPGVADALRTAELEYVTVVYESGLVSIHAPSNEFTLSGGRRDPNRIHRAKALGINTDHFYKHHDSLADSSVSAMEVAMVHVEADGRYETELVQPKASFNYVGGVEAFKRLNGKGIIVINAHGGVASMRQVGVRGAIQDFEFFVTNDHSAGALQGRYAADIRHRRIAIVGDHLCILPGFIRHYVEDLPNSFVWAGSCCSAKAGKMPGAFRAAGAGAYFGFHGNVYKAWNRDLADAAFLQLMLPGTTVAQALPLGSYDPYAVRANLTAKAKDGDSPARAMLLGNPDLTLDLLQHVDIDLGPLGEDWFSDPQSYTQSQHAGYVKDNGNDMFALTTLGKGYRETAIYTFVKIPLLATKIRLDWKLISDALEHEGEDKERFYAVASVSLFSLGFFGPNYFPEGSPLIGTGGISLNWSEAMADTGSQATRDLVMSTRASASFGSFAQTGWQSVELTVPKLTGMHYGRYEETADFQGWALLMLTLREQVIGYLGDGLTTGSILLVDNIKIK